MKKYIKIIKRYLTNLSIRAKLVANFSLLILLICIFIFWYFPFNFQQQAMKAVTEKTETIAIITATNLSPAMLYYNDTLIIKEYLYHLKSSNPDVVYIVVIDSLKNVLQSVNPELANKINFRIPKGTFKISQDGSILLFSYPIKFERKNLGSLYIGVSLINMNHETNISRLNIALISLTLLLFGFFIIYLLAKYITNPLNKVVKVFHLIAEGDLSQRVQINTSDEIGKLSLSFNSMVHKLEIAHNNLEMEIENRKQKEIQLENTQIKLSRSLEKEKKLNDMKTNFISMVSHEYRTPLTVIKTSAYLLEKFYNLNNYEDFARYLSLITTSANHMALLMDDTLEIGRLTSGRSNMEFEILNLNAIIKDIIKITEISDNNQHKITLTENYSENSIKSDSKMIYQIFVNLLSNACKYSPENSEVRIDIIRNNSDIQIDIKDNGIGIPENDLKYIFEPFFRASNVGFTQGTGLGMSIVKNSIDAIKAEIKVNSYPEAGSTFSVFLPENI